VVAMTHLEVGYEAMKGFGPYPCCGHCGHDEPIRDEKGHLSKIHDYPCPECQEHLWEIIDETHSSLQ
jgi:hypothetical protein